MTFTNMDKTQETSDYSLNESNISNNPNCQERITFYGIYIPVENKDDSLTQFVYSDKKEVLKVLKKNSTKRARFKAFNTVEEASYFAENGCENVNADTSNTGEESFPLQTGEKSSFRGPKPQELVKFRKSIESGDIEYVKSKIWENPRFLVSSGDTPSILQEGYRYNALHVVSKTEHVDMCKLILETISNLSFLQLLYGETNQQFCLDVMSILIDCYLNMPDKGLNETPLHFASKWGRYEIVELLTSYKECKMRPNKYGEYPLDIVCHRTEKDEYIMNKIKVLLNEQYYIPVLRSEDKSTQPKIGEPFSPKKPLVLNTNILSPKIEIQAFAGPMSKKDADEFSKKWKNFYITNNHGNQSADLSVIDENDSSFEQSKDSDNLVENTASSTPKKINFGASCKSPLVRFKQQNLLMSPSKGQISPIKGSPIKEHHNHLLDLDKGLERLGRKIAREKVTGWLEFWPFLGTFTNFECQKGLKLLENYLKQRIQKEYSLNNNSYEKSLRSVSLEFTENFCAQDNISNDCVSPITDLCLAFENCQINSKSSINDHSGFIMNNSNQLTDFEHDFINSINNPGLNPFLCVEKSCQVFAKRMSTFLLNIELGHALIMASLITEIKHLQSTIKSFSDDVRFVSVNFHLVHSRIAKLVTENISNKELENKLELNTIRKIINTLIENPYKRFDSVDTQNELHIRRKKKSVKGESRDLICILSHILSYLVHDNKMLKANTEANCIEVWSNASECGCTWINKTQPKPRNHLTRRNHFSRESSFDFSLPRMENIARRLFTKTDNTKNLSDSEQDSDDDVFVTPPSSPSLILDESNLEHVSSEDEMFDLPDDKFAAFIEGMEPTKLDLYVYQALEDCDINSDEYPHIYQWKHAVSLYPEIERECWPSPGKKIKVKLSDTSISSDLNKQFSAVEQWTNIVGPYSPTNK